MKTYKVDKNSEYVKDMGSYYLLTRNDWDGNIEIDLDKLCVVEGNQDVSGYQDISCNQDIRGYQDVTSICKAFNSKWWYYIKIDTLKIGCKEETWDEWDKWFKGKEVFSTERNTKDFELIKNGFECAKVMRKQLVIQAKYVKQLKEVE